MYCESFDKEAENIAKYLKQNEGVYILGDLEMRPHHSKGEYIAPLVVRSSMVKFLGNIQPAATHIWVTARGNLGDRPDLDYTDKKLAVCDFDIGVHSKDGDGSKKTTWVAVTTWHRQAEACHKYLDKGSEVIVRGSRVGSETWQTAKGEDRADLLFTAQTVDFLDRKPGMIAGAPVEDEVMHEIPW